MFLSNNNKMIYVVFTPYNTVGYVRIPNWRGHNDTREYIEHFCERHVSFLGARLLIDLSLYNGMDSVLHGLERLFRFQKCFGCLGFVACTSFFHFISFKEFQGNSTKHT